MHRSRVFLSACAAALLLASLLLSAGCGNQDSSADSKVPPGGPEMSSKARSAMEAQQKADAADRALHMKHP